MRAPAIFIATFMLGAAPLSTAWAQDYPPPPQYDDGYAQPAPAPGYDPCSGQRTDRTLVGGALGGAAGAVIGSSVTHGSARTGGAVIGGLAGAALGASVGNGTTNCPPAGYEGPPPAAYSYDNQRDDDYAPPPPAPPPPPPPQCGPAEVRTYFPDGTTEQHTVRACRDDYGHYRLAY